LARFLLYIRYTALERQKIKKWGKCRLLVQAASECGRAQAIEAEILFAQQKDWSGKRGFCEAKMRPICNALVNQRFPTIWRTL
jgi:hypothetical protein